MQESNLHMIFPLENMHQSPHPNFNQFHHFRDNKKIQKKERTKTLINSSKSSKYQPVAMMQLYANDQLIPLLPCAWYTLRCLKLQHQRWVDVKILFRVSIQQMVIYQAGIEVLWSVTILIWSIPSNRIQRKNTRISIL